MGERLTYIVDISDIDKAWERLEKRTKYEIKRCVENVYQTTDLDRFDELHKITRPERKIDKDYILRVWKNWNCVVFETTTAMAMIGVNGDTGYYLLGARDKRMPPDGSSSKILWEAMVWLNKNGYKKFNLCGANKPNIKLFKRGFGGELVTQNKPCLEY